MSEPQTTLKVPQVSVLDKEDPQSLYSMCPPQLQAAFDKAYGKAKYLFIFDEVELRRFMKQKKIMRPTQSDECLRMNFWIEYNRAKANNQEKMHMPSIYGGVCSTEYFHQTYLSRPDKVSFLFCPPIDYVTMMREALMYGIRQFREILDEEHVDDNGKINTNLLNIKLKIVNMIDLRLQGAIPQKNLNINVEAKQEEVEKYVEANEMDRLNRRLKELEKRDRQAKLSQ